MVDDARVLLEQTIKGKSDEEIMGFVGQFGGTETALDTIFEGVKTALNPDAAQDCIIGWAITDGDNTYSYTLIVKDKVATVERREPTDARVTLGLTITDFLRLIAGELDGTQAFMGGKLKLTGDMMFAMQVAPMFGMAAPASP